MTGARLLVGLIAMGIIVPVVLFFLLGLSSWSRLFVLAVTCFLGWGVADLVATIIVRPRLRNRSPSHAIRNWRPATGGDQAEPSEGNEALTQEEA